MARLSHRALAVATAALVVAAPACGTRLPDRAFRQAHRSAAPSATASPSGPARGEIRVGVIDSIGNFFDPRAFSGPRYGVLAFFRDLDAHGGVDGRQVRVFTCDDKGSPIDNQKCVRRLIDQDKVLAFVGNAIFDYAGAPYVQAKGVPDVGGQPVDTVYDTYSHLYSVYGSPYPRDGKAPGYDGRLYGGTEVYRWFRTYFHDPHPVAGVVFYNQADSRRFGRYIADGLRAEGFTVDTEEVNFAFADWASTVTRMRAAGVSYVFDALSSAGNSQLCRAIEQQHLTLRAKVTTTQGWTADAGSLYRDSPACRSALFAAGESRNYDDRSNAQVRLFLGAMHRYGYDTPDKLGEWALEAWGAAKWFTAAAASCGSDVTRSCIERFLRRPQGYNADGLFDHRSFVVQPRPPSRVHNCVSVARWRDSSDGGRGGWQTMPPLGDVTDGFSCFDVPYLSYVAGS